MRNRWWLIAALVVMLALAACGGDDKEPDSGGNGPANNTGQSLTPEQGSAFNASGEHVASGRSKPAPETDAVNFEAPFSVGQYVRESIRGRASAPQTGGQIVTYSDGSNVVVLNVLYFNTAADAMANVEYALEKADMNLQPVRDPYYSERRSFGVSEDRHGGYTAAWNNFKWVYIARADHDLAALNAFLDAFPY